MARKWSAALLMYRHGPSGPEVLLGHMGGPFWKSKDEGGWSIPKGEYNEGEDPIAVAKREFEEELGTPPPAREFLELGEIKQPSSKLITAWAVEGDLDAASCRSNTFTLEWPPRSGLTQEFPEIDRAAWFDLATAQRKLVKGQLPFIDRLELQLSRPNHHADPIDQLDSL